MPSIGILSGKGGVGKTTLTSNLGAAMTRVFGKRVVIVDSNVRTSHLGLHLGLYEDLPLSLKDVLNNDVHPAYAIYVHPQTGIRVLPSTLGGENINLAKLSNAIRQLKYDYETILVDCAPGLGRDVILSLRSIDSAIIITTPDLPSVTDTIKTIDLIKKMHKNLIGIVLNRVRFTDYELTVNEIESTCGSRVISIIPEEEKIPISIALGMPAVVSYPNSQVSIEIKKLAALLLGEPYSPSGLVYTLKKMFGLIHDISLPESEPTKEQAPEVQKEKEKENLKEEIVKKLREKESPQVAG